MADTAHSDGDSDVVVTLVATGSTQAGIRERRITLTRMEPTAPVGRSSKVPAKACLAAENNAWFETPVMSREHAEMTADFDKKTISLRDVGSLHGSFVRHKTTPQTEQRVHPNTSVQLESGDQLRFGTEIHRHQEKFPSCVVDFSTTWRNSHEGKKSPNTFSVPYGSDDEDPTSDSDSVIMMEQNLPPITKSSATAIDLTSTDGNASPQRMDAPGPARIIDLTAEEPTVDSDVSMTGLYSPVPSSRRSLSTSPAAQAEPMPALAGSGTAEWTDIESEEDLDCNSQSSEDLENLPLLSDDDDDDQSINSEDSVRFARMSEGTSEDSMSDSEMGSYDEDSDADSYEDDDEEDTYGYDWEATRTFGLPVGTVLDATAPVEHNSDGFDHDMVTQSDEESEFNETSPTPIWAKKSTPLLETHQPLGWSTWIPTNEVQYTPYSQTMGAQYVPQRQFSPSDAAMVKKHTPAVEGSGSSNTAQALGAKTGKFEYFEARDHNRHLAAPSSAPPAPELTSDRLSIHLPHYADPEPMSSLYNTGWSGTEFINQPQPAKQLESLEDRTRLQSPEPLDMTSAYAYQQSKSERCVPSPDVRRIPIPDLLAQESKEPSPARNVEPSPQVTSSSVPQPATRPPKRGIEEISGDVEDDTPVVESSPATVSMPIRVSERCIEAHPTKRRRIVEFAACVTLGGAAVLAGLITTAPQFA